MNVKVRSTFSFPGGWITIVLGLTTVLEKETKNISSSFSCEHSFDSIHPNSEIHFCHNHWYPFLFHVSYVGILSGYAISLVAWSWYTECADCPKVTISQSEWRQKSFCPNYDIIDQLEWRRITRSLLKFIFTTIWCSTTWLVLLKYTDLCPSAVGKVVDPVSTSTESQSNSLIYRLSWIINLKQYQGCQHLLWNATSFEPTI